MKTLQELLIEKEGYRKNVNLLDEKIQEFNKPTTLSTQEYLQYKSMKREGKEDEAKNYYTKLKEKYAENEKELNSLYNELEVNRLSNNLIDCNITIVFTALYKEKIINILNKYVKKRVGEKTGKKIENEIKEIDENIISVSLYINELIGRNFLRITLFHNLKIEFGKVDSWLNKSGELIKDISNYTSNNYNYIENIKSLAIEKIENKKKIKKEVEEQIDELKKKVREFNNFYCTNEDFKIDEYRLFR